MKKIFWGIFCFFILSHNVMAQESMPFNQIKFSITPSLYENLDIHNQNKNMIKSCSGFGGDFAISYYQRLYRGFGMNIGAGLTASSFNIKFNEDYLQDMKSFQGMTYPNFLYAVPVSLQLSIPDQKVKSFFYNMEIGAKFNGQMQYPMDYSYSFSTIRENQPETTIFDFKIAQTQQYFMSYFVKIGILKLTKKSNALLCNLVVNYTPNAIAKGIFSFPEETDIKYNSGTIQQSLNYIGIEFSYALTLCKKK